MDLDPSSAGSAFGTLPGGVVLGKGRIRIEPLDALASGRAVLGAVTAEVDV